MTQADQVGEIASFWVIALTSSLDLRERETALHSKRVQEYALFLARHLGIKEGDTLEGLEMGALLHDVGKIGVPDGILLKKGGLTDEERDVVRCHPDLGASLLQRIPFLSGAREIVESHHEKFDGSGYPKELKGEQIPIGAPAPVLDSSSWEYREAIETGNFPSGAGALTLAGGSAEVFTTVEFSGSVYRVGIDTP